MLVAIYIRVSTLDQVREGYSLAGQENILRDWCITHGHTVYNVYSDDGISGKDIKHRPGLLQALADAKQHKFDMLLIWSLSRFTRSVIDLYNTLEMLKNHDVQLTSHMETFDTNTAMGRAMMGMCGIIAQLEREQTAERVRMAMAERASEGKRTANYALGYDRDGKDSFSINQAGAKIVHYIFDRYEEYKNLSAVAECCNLKGYTGWHGRPFRAESIRKILTRSVYCGYNSFHGKLYHGDYQAIIDIKQYNHVQRLLSHSRPGRTCTHPYEEIMA